MLEGLLVFALLAGVLLGCVLLGQWGVHLQYAQMGARLLAFDAGDVFLAKFGRTGDEAVQTFTRDSVSWSAYSSTLPAAWLGLLLDSLPNDRYAGSVRGTQRGRLPSKGRSLFDFSSAALGYHSGSSVATNAWADTTADVKSKFLSIAWWVGYNEQPGGSVTSIPEVPPPPATVAILLGTIYERVGIGSGP